MANQIGRFFAHEGEAQAAASVNAHLKKFWDPRMRQAIVAYLDEGGKDLDPSVKLAVDGLR